MRVHWLEIKAVPDLTSLFQKVLSSPNPVFLDSSLTNASLGRYSYISADPLLMISSKNGSIDFSYGPRSDRRLAQICRAAADPLEALQRLLRSFQCGRIPGLPPFQGGVIGYFGYDLGRHIEMLPRTTRDDLGTPDMFAGLYDWVVAHDHRQDRTWLIVNQFDENEAAAEDLLFELRRVVEVPPSPPLPAFSHVGRPAAIANFTRDSYLRAIAKAKEYIAAGDIYEVCLSQRFAVALAEHPWKTYCRLRAISPVPYGAYLGFGAITILSGSPEMFLRLEGRRVETRPIKGTRPSSPDLLANRQLIRELRNSEKERAENLMIVDLLRNDLGRVCELGSVIVPEMFEIESYSTVHQMVSTIAGTLRWGLDAVDLLRACFPGGSVTGCPKIRAMQIIDELEPTQRGVYCGAIGLLGLNGTMETSIVIRTIVVTGGFSYLQVGGAVVADSDPAGEYQETLDKARAALLALGVASSLEDFAPTAVAALERG